ncbi:uncharacterized protein A1O9_05589 [Exophiala aquamarina CBS 119918]|uniref:Restriction endonuclease domain-containing protein n=1 Tax=Exophiala aquamarina CBS 119918 TaxID=1182545 RepID=A0A072PCV1_9EURO|nr:uncharacterized protein A1O9_05589 [Exophiala aquamarina CBS 119918]KEF57671.1 hypothetical protein A1O9_05589 [Exophiala aquamarina CBS 119918]
MDPENSCHDVAALQPWLDTGTGERSSVHGRFFFLNTPKPKSATLDEEGSPSAVSLLCLSGRIETQLQRVFDRIQSPPFPATPDWIEFPSEPLQFEELKKLEQLGYDYSEADEILTFRMAGAGHEWIDCELVTKISQGLEFALLPTSKCGSASLKYRSFKVAGKKLIQQPDAQFLSDLRLLPSLIIEVTWTQTTKNLQELVCDYILGSNARIRTVIGFDVGPAPRKRATVCDWRTVHNEDNIAGTCDSTEICTVSGVKNTDPQAGLRLTLEDFAYPRSQKNTWTSILSSSSSPSMISTKSWNRPRPLRNASDIETKVN